MKRTHAPALIPTRLPRETERGWNYFDAACDRHEITRLCEKEIDLDETLGFYATWSEGWWQTLREIDKVRGELIRVRRRMVRGA